MTSEDAQRQLSAQPGPNDLANIRMQVVERVMGMIWSAKDGKMMPTMIVIRTSEWKAF